MENLRNFRDFLACLRQKRKVNVKTPHSSYRQTDKIGLQVGALVIMDETEIELAILLLV